LKKVLIISPYFPPVNAADMQRVRMSLPYLAAFGWQAEVVMVDEHYTDLTKDPLLVKSVPTDIVIHKVKALSKKRTAKLGLGSIALRSLWFYRQKVNQLLKVNKYDLIFFSTTQFPVCVLGAYWKKRFGVPYVIDMQDPWYSDYYQDKPKSQRPPKYWFSYRLNKYLEPIALKSADGLISVSANYISTLVSRYPRLATVPAATITFGAFAPDLDIANNNRDSFTNLLDNKQINMVYIGRGGADMHQAIAPLFKALKSGAARYHNISVYFIGTSYAPAGQGKASIMPLAQQYDVQHQVIELTDRVSYYQSLFTLQQADALFIPGSDDPAYTASKIYPYLLIHKPLLAIFNKHSPAIDTLKAYGPKTVYDYETVTQTQLTDFLNQVAANTFKMEPYNPDAINKHSAMQMTLEQCQLFDKVING
jgi:hypothetical protein